MRQKRAELVEKRKKVHIRKHDDMKWISSHDVENKFVQNKSKEMVIIGSDCISLYPNLTKVESANEVAEAVLSSDIKWTGIDWKEASRYLVLRRSRDWCMRHRLRRVLPTRRSFRGTKPGMTGQGPLGAEIGDEKQWRFPKVEITEQEQKLIMSEVLKLAVETMYDTHMYSFGGTVYKQTEGGPIGLRSTCAVARVIMSRWDMKWKERLAMNNIQLETDARYVDDGRAILFSLRPGWRWIGSGLWFRADWEQEDKELSGLEITKRALYGSMQDLTGCLSFTVETSEDFPDGWLPTLDMKLRITSDNIIQYTFYEKPTSSRVCVQAKTALNQNCLIQSLTNEVIRRLQNISDTVPWAERIQVLDDLSQKLTNSGHQTPAIRKILIGGITGHERKLARCLKSGNPVNRSAAFSARARRRKKLLAKSNWIKKTGEEYKKSDKGDGKSVPDGWKIVDSRRTNGKKAENVPRGWKARGKSQIYKNNELKISTVLFVDFSHQGSLQTDLRNVTERLAPMLGFKVRVSEKGGTPLSSLLSNKN